MAKITIFGLAGTGTSSVGKLLAEKLGYSFVSTGNIFRKKASDLGLSLQKFEELARTDPKYDKELDEEIVAFGKANDNFVVESRLAWFFIPDSVKIKLDCDFDERVRRVSARDGVAFEEGKRLTLIREPADNKRYQEIYGITDIDSEKNFDFTIDTTSIPVREVVEKIVAYLNSRS